MSFNLITEKWIPVVNKNLTINEISLVELFENWQSYREITGENPPTILAIYRFLLAIIHRAYMGPINIDHWQEIQEEDGKEVIKYLQNKVDCFDLFHPDQPFMQDPELSQIKEPVPIYVYSAFQFADKSTVFSHLHLWSGYTLSFAEASRVLVRVHTLDVSGTRAFYPNTEGSRSAAEPSTINSVNTIIMGGNLKETLLFNLIQYDPKRNKPKPFTGEDIPFWEIGYSGKPRIKEDNANGYLRFLTYPWRRLLLYYYTEMKIVSPKLL